MRLTIPTLVLLLAACESGPKLGPPVTVAAANAANPTLAVDPRNGVVYVAWVQTEADSGTSAFVIRRARDGSLGSAMRLNDRAGDVMLATQNPAQVVVGADGTVYVGWVSDRAPAGSTQSDITIRLVRSADEGRTFSPPTSFTIDSTRLWPANMYYDLAAAPDSSLYISWLDLHYYTDTVAARAVQHVPDSIPVPENRVDFRVARSTDGGRSFSGPVILDSSSCICCRTAIAAGPDGSVHALWRHVFPGDIRDFVSARSTDGATTFSASTRLHEDHWVLNGCPDIGPDVAVDGAGVVHAAWYTGAPGRVGLWYAASTDGGATFSAPVALLPKGHAPPSEVKLATAQGETWGAWEDRRQLPTTVRMGRPGRGRVITVGQGSFPAIAAGGDLLAIAWETDGAVSLRVASGVGETE